MPICTYCDESRLKALSTKDTEIVELLKHINELRERKFYALERVYVTRRWFRKPVENKYYELFVDLGYGEFQVVNFAQDHDWTINTIVTKSYILTYLLGFLGGMSEPEVIK